MNLRREGLAAQREQVNLRISSKHETCVQKAVDPRSFISITAVQRKSRVTQSGDRAHDTVRFEDADAAVGAESGRHRPKRMRFHEPTGFAQSPFEADLATHLLGRDLLAR